MNVGLWFAASLSIELAVMSSFIAVLLLVHLATRAHVESKQKAREHAELRESFERNAEMIKRNTEMVKRNTESLARQTDSIKRQTEMVKRQAASNDRRFDSIDRKLDQILKCLLEDRSANHD